MGQNKINFYWTMV